MAEWLIGHDGINFWTWSYEAGLTRHHDDHVLHTSLPGHASTDARDRRPGVVTHQSARPELQPFFPRTRP
ncbi:unnamed protein product [Periconia digitata]|uniref:Uncharacterized protein n=1 Tax=Periconia digitata TaxID=1303443 RepID=A0A9W4UUZ7_9PLEO|nr:unnamed protein product [Periconia digitata]